jgi:hypothetical protein
MWVFWSCEEIGTRAWHAAICFIKAYEMLPLFKATWVLPPMIACSE